MAMVLVSTLLTKADNYKILATNSPQILVDGKQAKVGMTFSDQSKIVWKKEKQAMRVVNLQTRKQAMMVAYSLQKNSQTAYEILTTNKHLSTHDGRDTFFARLRRLFAPSYVLMDAILIPTDIVFSDSCYLYASYDYGDAQVSKRLKVVDGNIVIDRTLFNIEGRQLEPRDILLSIEYRDDLRGTSAFVKADIEITVVPEQL